nr:uncharacterized protein LOC104087814 [Nicotiana tomentosiformis]
MTIQKVARFFYDNGIPFNVARSKSFKEAVEAIGRSTLTEKKKEETPCAAHCIDLMLEDIEKIPNIKKALQRAIALVGFIYRHSGVLNMMRDFTKNKELVKCGITRFATSFLTLQRLQYQKTNLRAMFTSEKWVISKWSKLPKGKSVAHTVLMEIFWNQVMYILKIMGPLVKVLRLVDNKKKPAMGYIYEAMDRAKEAIAKAFGWNIAKYKDIFKIIDERWQCQLHHPLHAVGHYLNPEYFYQNSAIENFREVTDGLYACIEKLVPSTEVQDKIISEIPLYTKAEQQFGLPIVKRSRATRSPASHLQKLAIRILGLTTSAAGCEHNWSVFEHYNRALKARYDLRSVIDPISLDNIDHSNEWLVGKMGVNVEAEDELVFGDDSLTWGDVARASGSENALTYTMRQKRQSGDITANASSSRAPRIESIDIEDEIFSDESGEEEIGGYSSSDTNENHSIEEDYMEEYYFSD